MRCGPGRPHGVRAAFKGWISTLRGTAGLLLAGAVPAVASAQQGTSAPTSLVFDGVTVVDVEQGELVPDQRVVIAGNRIRTVGKARAVKLPKGAQVVDARGKYLIPGLWDMHTHSLDRTDLFYPLFIAHGITGIRDAGSFVSLDSLIQWRREILVGDRVGPPRQILSGPPVGDPGLFGFGKVNRSKCNRESNVPPGSEATYYTCVLPDSADARKLVDSLRAAGVDMLKAYELNRAAYLALAHAARQAGIPFGGHITWDAIGDGMTYVEASDSGMRILDHDAFGVPIFRCWGPIPTSETTADSTRDATVDQCRPIAERFRQNDTWWVPTLITYRKRLGPRSEPVYQLFEQRVSQYWGDSGASTSTRTDRTSSARESSGWGEVAQRVGMPLLAGTDATSYHKQYRALPPGLSLHTELAIYVAEGLTPSRALQTATLNPAKFLHATDSLGTVAAGKLADLVLLDADPLADITNTTTIRAVVANGRYFDRAALDGLLTEVRAKASGEPSKP